MDYPFIIYADCEVIYNGRASSYLKRGNYFIIRKEDKSLIIHDAQNSNPKNYMSKSDKIIFSDNEIIVYKKKETIKIKLYDIILQSRLSNWSTTNIEMMKTEKQLVQKIMNNHESIIGIKLKEIYNEYPTAVGPIDILGIDTNDVYYIIEVKRKTCVISHCSQVKRYMECFPLGSIGIIAAPDISKKAKYYLEKNSIRFIRVNFED